MIYNLNYSIKIEVIEWSGYNLFYCYPYENLQVKETFSFIYNIFNANFNQFGLNETLYNECLSFIQKLFLNENSLLTSKPIYILGVSYGGAISQILAAVIYNLKYGSEKYSSLKNVEAVFSFGSFRICNKEGINYFKNTKIPIYNYVACHDEVVDLVSLLPSCTNEENINTIYYDLWKDKEVKIDLSKYNSGLIKNLLYLGTNLYKHKNWLNPEELMLHNMDIYLKIKDRFGIQI